MTKGKIELKGMEKALSILKGVLDYSNFKDVDTVIEVSHYVFYYLYII